MKDLLDLKEFISTKLITNTLDQLNQYIENTCSNQSMNQAASQILIDSLPDIKQPVIKVLEICAISGSATQKAIKKYQGSCQRIEATVLFLNTNALELSKLIFNTHFPSSTRLKINLLTGDYLENDLGNFDIIIGFPQISRLRGQKKKELCSEYVDYTASNTVAFLTQKALKHAEYLGLFLPKYFLGNFDFENTRKAIDQFSITHIYDYSEMVFHDCHQEIISITINKNKLRENVYVFSFANNKFYLQLQSDITNNGLNIWTIYTDLAFRAWLDRMQFGIFDVYRDRQLKVADFKDHGEIRVLKSQNIPRYGKEIIYTEKDKYINSSQLKSLKSAKFLNRTDVYLCPNLTTKPRLVQKPNNCIASGSLAILITKPGFMLNHEDICYFASEEFEIFYNIGRNLSSRSLNIDKSAVKLFGKRKV